MFWLIALALAGLQPGRTKAEESNPYLSIVERNPFGLKPPPPPPSAEDATPVTPPAKVTLTGLVTMFGEPRALFEILEQDGSKTPTPKKPILREGERVGSVEVLSINVEKNLVRIRNGTLETNITFEVAKASTGPATLPPPGMPPVPGALPMPPGMPTAANPALMGPGRASQPGGVTLLGGGSTTPARPSIPGMPTMPGAPQPGSATTLLGGPATATPGTAVPSPLGSPVQTGLRTLPMRRLRTDQPPLPTVPTPAPYQPPQ